MLGRAVVTAFLLIVLSCGAALAEDEDWISKLPQPAPGMGRIFIYRVPGAFGAMFQPAIYVNDQKIADAEMRRVHVIDRPAGNYSIRISLEVTKVLDVSLDAGQTRYVRLVGYPGVVTMRLYPELKEDSEGAQEIQRLKRGKTFEPLSVPEDPSSSWQPAAP